MPGGPQIDPTTGIVYFGDDDIMKGGHGGGGEPPPPPQGGGQAGADYGLFGQAAYTPERLPLAPLRRRYPSLRNMNMPGMQMRSAPGTMQNSQGMGAEQAPPGVIPAPVPGGSGTPPPMGSRGRIPIGKFGPRASLPPDPSANWPKEPNIRNVLGAGGASGAFDPFGSEALFGMLSDYSRRESQGAERRGVLAAELESGDDPYLRAYGALNARLGAGNQRADTLTRLRGDMAGRSQDWLRDLYASYISGKPYEKKDGTDWGAVLGQIAGAVGGAALGKP